MSTRVLHTSWEMPREDGVKLLRTTDQSAVSASFQSLARYDTLKGIGTESDG